MSFAANLRAALKLGLQAGPAETMLAEAIPPHWQARLDGDFATFAHALELSPELTAFAIECRAFEIDLARPHADRAGDGAELRSSDERHDVMADVDVEPDVSLYLR